LGKIGKTNEEKSAIFHKWQLFSGYKVWLDSNRTNCGDVYLVPRTAALYDDKPYKNTMQAGIATGNFSGYAAVNLAMCLGANPIYLLGYDCKHSDGKTHYHSGYDRTADEMKLKQLAIDFLKLKKKADSLGVKIINLTAGSAVTAFAKGNIRDVLPALDTRAREWMLISFYTKGTSYEQEVKKLEQSLKNFNIPYHFYGCKQYGSWRANLNCKSASILEAFKRFPDKDIVFVDSDALVRQYPELFDRLTASGLHDMAAHFHVYPQSVPGGSLLSGTLWFKNHVNTIDLVERWHKIGVENPLIRHQHCLRLAIEQKRAAGQKVSVFRMPREYTCIFDYRANRGARPVIEHFQASRRLRREVGKGQRLLDSNFLHIPNVVKQIVRMGQA